MKFLELTLNEDEIKSSVFAVSIVKSPAIEVDFIKLKEEKEIPKVKLTNTDKRIITGPALTPDKWIYRTASQLNGEEGYIKFSSGTIEKTAHNFLSFGKGNNVNLEHDIDTDKLLLIESYLLKSAEEVTASGFDVPVGTWMLSYKVCDDEIWSDIKNGEYNGFSIEGHFLAKYATELSAMSTEETPIIKEETTDEVVDLFE
jgi:hypothetical protein